MKRVFECLVILVFLTLISFLFGSGDRFINVNPNPFWIPVLIMTVQYGTYEGIIAAILSTLFLYVGNVPQQMVDETAFEYQFRISLKPFLWFSTAYVLGQMRLRLQDQIEDLQRDKDKAKQSANAITKNYEILKTTKENLEKRLAGQINTVSKTYKTVRGLESSSPVQILMSLDQIVSTALAPKKFSVYASGENGLEATTSKGWEETDVYLRRFSTDHPIYKEVVDHKRMITVINEEDELILAGEGVIAAPLIDNDTQKVFGMIKIEELDLLSLDIGSLETFKTLCNLIGSAYSNAVKYKVAKSNATYVEGTKVFSDHLYPLLKQYLLWIAKRANIQLSEIQMELTSRLTRDEKKKTFIKISDILMTSLPAGTPILQTEEGKIGFNILLPATQQEVAGKISLKTLEDIARRYPEFIFHIKVDSLFKPKAGECQKV